MHNNSPISVSCPTMISGWEGLQNIHTRVIRTMPQPCPLSPCCTAPPACRCIPYPVTGPQGPTGPIGPTGAPGTSSTLQGVQYQLTNGQHMVVAPGENIIFNTALNHQSPFIYYDVSNGAFTLSAPGNYFVSWWVATDGTDAATDLWFSLQVDLANAVMGATPVITGQLSGSALITVGNSPASVTLCNTTPMSIALASTPVQANMILFQIL